MAGKRSLDESHMNALMMRLAVSMASLVLALATSSAHAAGASMDKYGFSVVFPNGYEICETRPAGFLHGYYVRLDHRSCGSDKPGSAMGLYADFNTTLYSDVRSGFLPGCLPPSLDSPMSQLRFSTLESAVCWRNGKHGRKEIYVEAMSADAEDSPFPEKVPSTIYTAFLDTTKGRFEEDMKAFEEMLASVRFSKVPLDGEN